MQQIRVNLRSYRVIILYNRNSYISVQEIWTIHQDRSSRILLRLRPSFFVHPPARCFPRNLKEPPQESRTKLMIFSHSCWCNHVHTSQSNGGILMEDHRVKDAFCPFCGLCDIYPPDEKACD